jgi:hypothetical protein
MTNMEEYQEAGEALGRLINTYKYPQVALFCLTIIPLVLFIGFKFLLT